MIGRRIAAHLGGQNWTAIAIEFAIVVVGVFVGIQAANFNAERQERALEQAYRERIVADLDTIIKNATDEREYEINKSRGVVAALALANLPPSDDTVLRLGQTLIVTSLRLSPNLESPTFNDLAGSGRLTLIRDPTLRRNLSVYFARLQYLRAAALRNNEHFAEPFVDWLRAQDIGPGFTGTERAEGVTLSPIDHQIADFSIKHFGVRSAATPASRLRLPLSNQFWAGLRSNLLWRGHGAAANENILSKVIDEARTMQDEVRR